MSVDDRNIRILTTEGIFHNLWTIGHWGQNSYFPFRVCIEIHGDLLKNIKENNINIFMDFNQLNDWLVQINYCYFN